MKNKQERIKEVYAHVRAHHGVHTQTELASVLHVTQPVMSAAINGNEAYLTKNLFMKICAAFPGVFNLDYLLNGKGDLLTPEEQGKCSDIEYVANRSVNEAAYNEMLEMCESMMRNISEFRSELEKDINEFRSLMQEFRNSTSILAQAIKELNVDKAV